MECSEHVSAAWLRSCVINHHTQGEQLTQRERTIINHFVSKSVNKVIDPQIEKSDENISFEPTFDMKETPRMT